MVDQACFTPRNDEENELTGNEHGLEPKPDWYPRFPGSARLSGKVAIVTGADSGIGRAVAVLFAREGAKVALAYLSGHEDARITAQAVAAEGSEALLSAGDIGDPRHAHGLIDAVIAKWGKLDIVVNYAGERHPDPDSRENTAARLQRTVESNVFSMFYLVQVARQYLKPGAAIINCTSVTSYEGSDELLDYSATKGAVTAFTRSLSKNLIGDGIRVNAVAPGPIWTPLNESGGASPEKFEHFGLDTPLGRGGHPNDVAPAFLFLACADSGYMSGQVLHPNGGQAVNG